MKSIGIIRRVDELGRIVLPVELRRSLSIKAGKDKENNKMMELYRKGFDTYVIANILNKSQLCISDRIKALGG